MSESKPAQSSRAEVITLWILAGVFLMLSAWMIPGSIWGTSEWSPLGGGRIYFFTIPILVIALALLWLAIRVQRRRKAPTP